MLLKELIKQLTVIEKDPDNQEHDLYVTICNYDEDTDEHFHFKIVDGVEQVESARQKWVSIYINK